MLYTKSYTSVNIHRLGLVDLEVEVRNSYNDEVLATGVSLAEILTNPESLIQDEEGTDRFSLWYQGNLVCSINKLLTDGHFAMRVAPIVEFKVALGWYVLQLTKDVIPEEFDLLERVEFLLVVARFGGTDKLGYDLWFAAVRYVMEVTGQSFVTFMIPARCLWQCAHQLLFGEIAPHGWGPPNIDLYVVMVAFVRMVFKYFVTRYVKREKVLTSQPFRLETKPFRHGERA